MATQDVFDRVLERWSLQPEDLDVGPQVLGAGSFGEVRAGTLRDGNSTIQVAVKLLPMNGNCEETWNKIGAEAVLLAKVSERCKSTSRLYGICRKDDKFCLVMKKYVTSLEKKISEYPDRKAPRKKVEQWALDICQAVVELHGQNVIFRDLKPSNVLLDEFGGAILADFGISKMVERTVAQRRTSTTVAGTLNYMAPETFTARAEDRSSKVDVWAFGCLLLELHTGKAPWEGLDMGNIMYQVVCLKGHPALPSEMNRDLVDALEQCFVYDPAKRASAMTVLEALRKAYYQAAERSTSSQEKCHLCSSSGVLATCLQCTSKFSMQHTPPSLDSMWKIESLEREVEALTLHKEEAESLLSASEEDVVKLKVVNEDQKRQLDATARGARQMAFTKTLLEGKVARLETMNAKLLKQVTDLQQDQARLEYANYEAESRKLEIQELSAMEAALKARVIQLESRKEDLSEQISGLTEKVAGLEEQKDLVQQSIRSSQTKSLYDGHSKGKAASSSDEELLKDDPYHCRCWGAMADVAGEPKVVVGLDFGGTHSGYAFAQKSKPEEILVFNDWPRAMKSYCKTLSALYYEPGDATTAKLKSWGFPALHDYCEEESGKESDLDVPEIGTLLLGLKFNLADKDAGYASEVELPEGFTATQVVADYLREIGASILRHLRTKFSNDLTMADVQWCMTVPFNGDYHVKRQLQVCMARAGLVRSSFSPEGSPHPLSLVLEGEAASCYCHRNMPGLELKVGDRLLVADIGGTTTDIVVQEWMSETPGDYRVKEVTYKSKDGMGGLQADRKFFDALEDKVESLSCFRPQVPPFNVVWILEQWEEIKCSFGNLETIGESFKIHLPIRLAADWEKFDEEEGNPPRSSYDELELTHADIQAIFDPIVEKNLALITKQISRTTNVKVIFVVGGLAGSPYLLTKIKERFVGTVEKVWSPEQPGSAVCQGAVMLALSPADRMRYEEYSSEDDS